MDNSGKKRINYDEKMRLERIRWQKIKQEMGEAKNLAHQVRNEEYQAIEGWKAQRNMKRHSLPGGGSSRLDVS